MNRLACDDTLACNVGETCTLGTCGGGAAVDCTGTGDVCNADSTCDPLGLEGNCDTAGAFINEGGACDDTLACNVGETCTTGTCGAGGALRASSAINSCTDDDTGTTIAGDNCVTDPLIGDGYTVGFTIEASYARVIGQESGTTYCP